MVLKEQHYSDYIFRKEQQQQRQNGLIIETSVLC